MSMTDYSKLTIGILALQGDFERHEHQLRLVGATPRLVKMALDLKGLNGIIFPGGESTTMSILLDKHKLREPLTAFCRTYPVYGTCAGMIMLSSRIEDNLSGVTPLGLMDISVVRNGYGRQVFSVEETIEIKVNGTMVPVEGAFIRAPRIVSKGPEVMALAEYKGDPALVRQGNLLASSFHAELEHDTTVLRYFLDHFFE